MPKAVSRKKFILRIIIVIIIAAAIGFAVTISFQPSSSNIKVFFLKGEKLTAVERKPNKKGAFVIIAQSLSKGPTQEEIEEGFYTEIPKGSKILSVEKKGGIAIVDFNSALEGYGGGATRVQGLIGQIVYSFTELPNIDEVKITVAGKDEIILGGEGFVIDKPLGRDDINL